MVLQEEEVLECNEAIDELKRQVCVCVRVHACVHACVCVHLCVVCMYICECMHECVHERCDLVYT